jgi:crotonobetainyl-CoA:carnitine CoA-transferase CaiB-like acyl-CoA transferase
MGSKWNASLARLRPLAGVRVLSMEQAAALPFATRHLADLGADVIRVQSHKRPAPDTYDIEFTRNKRQLAIDLATPGGPDAFRRVAAACDIVCHNFTPQVVRKFGIDYESLRALRPDIIYLELTGFGTDGPWRSRPLFGPGAEALAGHNLLIGDPDQWPGRPPTITYADNTCGLYAVLALTDALARKEQLGTGSHLDISLYETAVSQLGPVLAERGLGAVPERNLNGDAAFAFQGSYRSGEPGRYVAVSVPRGAQAAAAAALGTATGDESGDESGIARGPAAGDESGTALGTALGTAAGDESGDEAGLAAALAGRPAGDAAAALQAAGIPAAVVADAAVVTTDEQLWARGYFGLLDRHDHGLDGEYAYSGPPFGGGADADIRPARPVGADSREILASVAGYPAAEIDALFAAGAVGTGAPGRPGAEADPAIRIERGELSRVDPDFRERIAAAKDHR